ncbi:MAG TPA: hypothetical protein VFP21_07155 [Solirubrobacterales bacterium]|nr:hypothetical protein [Solirubrobacterales bacterium]
MNDDPTPINARPTRRPPEAFEDLSLALREHLLWPVGDRLLGLGDRGRAAVAGGAVVLALGLGIGGYALSASGGSEPAATGAVATLPERAPHAAPTAPAPKPKPEPTLHGAAPTFEPAQDEGQAKIGTAEGDESGGASPAADTGNPATDTISSSPAATASGPAAASASASTSTAVVKGPPAGPAAIAVAHKFAQGFVVYETGGDENTVREAFSATATPELSKALLRRPPRQPAGVKVPKAKVLNVVPAPSHGTIYPLSVSLLRVGVTSELRLEMEQLKDEGWRVTNVLG